MARYAVTTYAVATPSLPVRVTGTSLVHFAGPCNASREKAFLHPIDIDRVGTRFRPVFLHTCFAHHGTLLESEPARTTVGETAGMASSWRPRRRETLRNVVKDS
jgi:hypothetical protein